MIANISSGTIWCNVEVYRARGDREGDEVNWGVLNNLQYVQEENNTYLIYSNICFILTVPIYMRNIRV